MHKLMNCEWMSLFLISFMLMFGAVTLNSCGSSDGGINSGSTTTNSNATTGRITGKTYIINSTTPIAGVVVSIGATSYTSSADGTYILDNILTGSSTINATKSGYDGYSETVTIATGTNTKDIYMTSSIVTGVLDGYVKDDCTNAAIGGATVSVGLLVDTTDATGHYQLPSVPQGSVHMIVSKSTYTTFITDFYLSSASKTFNVTLHNDVLPQKPGAITITSAPTYINIYWSASADCDVVGYMIYRNGTFLKTETSGLSTTDHIPVGTQYCYTISAVDSENHESQQTTQKCGMASGPMHVPDIGQTTSYTNTFGEDHDYSINAPFYTDNGDGTITDNVTGLIWQKQDDGVGLYWTDNFNTYCESNAAGLPGTGWRLPTAFELITIVDYDHNNPAINSQYFKNTKSWFYWSSSTLANGQAGAWLVHFDDGGDGLFFAGTGLSPLCAVGSLYCDGAYYVRCVR